MLKAIIKGLTTFDWVTPSVGLVQDFLNDPDILQRESHTFFIPYDQALATGWNAIEIEKLVKGKKYKIWGSQITNGTFFFRCSGQDAGMIASILMSNSVPIDSKSFGYK